MNTAWLIIFNVPSKWVSTLSECSTARFKLSREVVNAVAVVTINDENTGVQDVNKVKIILTVLSVDAFAIALGLGLRFDRRYVMVFKSGIVGKLAS